MIDNREQRYLLLIGISLLALGCSPKPRPISQSHDSVVAVDQTAHEARGYIGSQSCAECHEEIIQEYQGHSMGRSAARLSSSYALPKAELSTFEADGFRYSVRQQEDDWIHHQARLTKDGSEIASVDLVAQHVIGSGNHGQSFLIERDGYLFMSPITWYPDKQIWDLSPGYEKNNSQFNRPVVETCLYCHTHLVSAVPNTLNQYESPPILNHAIGCERCHGPGSEHVAKQQSSTSTGSDPSIVNPGKLTADLREAVCQQCHLSGATRVTKPGKSLYDYRPGELLESAYTVFSVQKDTEGARFVGHVEQMYSSQCFQGSDGALGCISCHDPHGIPVEEERVSFYRDRCLQCHTAEACGQPPAERLAVTAEDSCIVCHMPSRETEIRHAAVTDHSVPGDPDSKRSGRQRSGPMFAFPSDDQSKPTARDKAIALVRVGGRQPELFVNEDLDHAQRSLEKTVASSGDDFEAMEALAELYLAGNDFENAQLICRKVLAKAPRREQTLVIMGDTLNDVRKFDQAIPIWKQAIEVNPWMSKYWYKLGQAYAATKQWFVCRQVATEAKRRFPTSIGVRHLLVQCNLELGDHAAAEIEFREVEQFNPRGFGSLRDWYNHARQIRGSSILP